MTDSQSPPPTGTGTPPVAGEPPSSPATVKKTAIKTPKEIELEKKVSRAEDRLDFLESWQKETNAWFASLNLGDKPPPKPPASGPAAPKKGFLEEMGDFCGLD